MLLSSPIQLFFSVVGVVAYIVSYFITKIPFKEDRFFHKTVFALYFATILVIYILTVTGTD